MRISVRLPQWDWIAKLFDRWAPNTVERARLHGKAGSSKRWLGGIVEVETIVETEDDQCIGSGR